MEHRCAALLIAGVASCAATDAWADGNKSLQATATVSGGWTDNVLNSPETDDPTLIGVEGDIFTRISPGLRFSQESRRTVTSISYSFSARMYAEQGSANSYSNALRAQTLLLLSPLSEVGFYFGLTNGRTNAFDTQVSPDGVVLEAQPEGDTPYVNAFAQQTFFRRLNRAWRFKQTSGLSLFATTDDSQSLANSVSIRTSLGLERRWQFDVAGLSWRNDLQMNEQTDGDGNSESQFELITGPQVRWLHDISRTLSSELSLGLLGDILLRDPSRNSISPVASASLRYVTEYGQITAQYVHTVQPNMFIARTQEVDSFALRASIPVPFIPRLGLSGSAGYVHGEYIDLGTDSRSGMSERITLAVGLSGQLSGALVASIRYSDARQRRSRVNAPGVVGTAKRQVLVSLTAAYPGRESVGVPSRRSRRVDQSDEAEFGTFDDASAPGVTDRRD